MKDKELLDSLKEYIESGQYFKDARAWYRNKYIYPFSHRSFLALIFVFIFAITGGIAFNLYNIFPMVIQVKYSIQANDAETKTAQIIRANQLGNDPVTSVTDVLVRNYITNRENYNYDRLKNQFIYIKNNSTRIVFREFYNFMNIDNSSSPVLTYQKSVRRNIKVLSANYYNNKAVVNFESIAKNQTGEIIENMVWQTTIHFVIDKIDPKLPAGSKFNFTVTEYKLLLIKDKLKK